MNTDRSGLLTLDRRDLMKMGVGTGVVAMTQMLNVPHASALEASESFSKETTNFPHSDITTCTHTGWKNTANRASGNGPIDETSRKIIEYVSSFDESNLTVPLTESLNYVMLDCIASLIAGFESEPARICARLAQKNRSDYKSTVMGYGVTTTPELAAFANSSMHRHTDFDINEHVSDIIPGILAMGEALHVTGSQVLIAVTIGYEVVAALGYASHGPGRWDTPYVGPATALAVGKMMGLNEDQLANALSLALVPHMPLRVSHTGALSMWKGCHDAEAVRCGVFAALAAQEGMTGPSMPFEGRNGLWDHNGAAFKDLRFPALSPDGRLAVQRTIPKKFPADGNTQAVLEMLPAFMEWTKVDDIESIRLEMPFGGWQENADPAKWDPRNRETADHSLPYVISRFLIDGTIYLDSYTSEKIMDPAVRQLMEKIVVTPNNTYTHQGQARLTFRAKSGAELVKSRDVMTETLMTPDEMVSKYNRVCTYKHIADEQRDRARTQWMNLKAVKDIAGPIGTLANFGKPLPLADAGLRQRDA